jgi:conjugative transfer signal peptidase TraF
MTNNIDRKLLAAGVSALAALTLVSIFAAPDLLLYNPSSSIPPGFYIRSRGPAAPGAIVTVRSIDVAQDYAAARNFADADDRFIKRVAAIGGQVVCAHGAELSIDGRIAAIRRAHDSAGRALPAWSGCRALSDDEFLLLGDTPDSFDGRYWGPVSRSAIEGVWHPLAQPDSP